MAGAWNALPGVVVVEADMIVVLMRLLERYMEVLGIEEYGK